MEVIVHSSVDVYGIVVDVYGIVVQKCNQLYILRFYCSMGSVLLLVVVMVFFVWILYMCLMF